MIAVLPFQNLTGDASQDYLSDGLTEEMITQLGNLDSGSPGCHRQNLCDAVQEQAGVVGTDRS